MKKKSILLGIVTLFLCACNNSNTNSSTTKNKENKLLKQEKRISAQNSNKIEDKYLISNDKIGDFRLGDSIPFFSTTYNVRKEKLIITTEKGVEEEILYGVSVQGMRLINLIPEYDDSTGTYTNNIGEIVIISEKFKTKKGIGLHSTLKDFTKAYPDYSLWYSYISRSYGLETKQLRGQFLLNYEDFIGNIQSLDDIVILKISDFKKGSKISDIRIF